MEKERGMGKKMEGEGGRGKKKRGKRKNKKGNALIATLIEGITKLPQMNYLVSEHMKRVPVRRIVTNVCS
jgi:hypothetical protein